MGKWLRGLDSNQDNQLQRLACYQLHYPGKEKTFYFSIAGHRQKSSRLEGLSTRVRVRCLPRSRQFVSLLKPCGICGDSTAERCPSGLRSTLGKRVLGKLNRGFKSHPLRHPSLSVLANCFLGWPAIRKSCLQRRPCKPKWSPLFTGMKAV